MNIKSIATAAALTIIGGCTAFVPAAEAGYSCRTNVFGSQECSGSMNGQSFNSTTRSNVFGGYETEGSIGGQSFSQTCSSSVFGGYDCY